MIQYYRKNVFGNELMYLIDSAEAGYILRLICQRTINQNQINLFTNLGIKFEEVLAPKS